MALSVGPSAVVGLVGSSVPVFAASPVPAAVVVPVFSDGCVGSDCDSVVVGVGVVASDSLVEAGVADVVEVDEGVGVVSLFRLNMEAHSFRSTPLRQHQVSSRSSAAQ